MNNVIVIGEPQCWDFEHSRVNAALIQTALLAFPDTRIVFLGERLHIIRVRDLLEKTAGSDASRVEWNEVIIPPRQTPTIRRVRREFLTLRAVFRAAKQREPMAVLYTSATELGFLILKVILLFHRHGFPILVVMHGLLATLTPNTPRKAFASIRGMRLVFRLPHPHALVYLALGPSIYRSLTELQPRIAHHTVALEHPFSWISSTAPTPATSIAPVVRFGFFGASGGRGKGFDRFVRLAEQIRPMYPNAEFSVVGHLSTDNHRARHALGFPDASLTPISPTEYGEFGLRLTYAVSTTDPDVYRVSASASFLDALSCVKPGIYLRNPYIEEYFGIMGDIGYLCNSVDEMQHCILEILKEFPAERYRVQCENILRGRTIFEPLSISPTFRRLVEEARKRL